jgi:hypothetical protein
LLEQGHVRERVIHKGELQDAEAIFRVNSVRGWQAAEIEECDTVRVAHDEVRESQAA